MPTIGLPILLQENRWTDHGKYIKSSQIHECGNLYLGRAVSFRGINKSDFLCSVTTKKTRKYLEGEPDVVQCEVVRLEAEEDG
jgi:hypothetical protein